MLLGALIPITMNLLKLFYFRINNLLIHLMHSALFFCRKTAWAGIGYYFARPWSIQHSIILSSSELNVVFEGE